MGNDNWWRTHGIGCEGSGDTEGSGAGGNDTTECIVSYAVSETHTAIISSCYNNCALALYIE